MNDKVRQRSRKECLSWLARRPRWHGFGARQATDPKKRRDTEETSRYVGDIRDV